MQVTLQWSYTPEDYFTEPLHVPIDNYVLDIDNGWITTTIEIDPDDFEQQIREIEAQIFYMFQFTQLESLQPYAFFQRQMPYRLPSGEIEIRPLSEWRVASARPQAPKTPETAAAEQKLVTLAIKYGGTDDALAVMLDHYTTAIRDPAKELAHLYNIRDTLKRRFGNEEKVKDELQLSKSWWKNNWKELGKLADFEPLRQGRHPGYHYTELRDATPDELAKARAIAKRLMFKYIQYLDRQLTE